MHRTFLLPLISELKSCGNVHHTTVSSFLDVDFAAIPS